MARLALLLVFCGLVAVLAGVWVLAGYGWALVAMGAVALVFGLAVIDVDGKGEGGKSA